MSTRSGCKSKCGYYRCCVPPFSSRVPPPPPPAFLTDIRLTAALFVNADGSVRGVTFTVSNISEVTAANVAVTIIIPPSAIITSITETQGTVISGSGTIAWQVSPLFSPSASATITITIAPSSVTSLWTGTATTTTTESNLNNNTASVIFPGQLLTDLQVTVFSVEGSTTITFSVANISGVTANDVVVSLVIPGVPEGNSGRDVSFLATRGSVSPANPLVATNNIDATWTIGTLVALETESITLTNGSPQVPGTWLATAATSTPESDTSNNSASTNT